MANVKALFWPQSIVLVGASTDKTIIRGRIVEAIQRYPYTGSICAVSRSHQMIGNLKCYASVDDLPGAVDLAIITIPADYVAAALDACGRKGIQAAIVISSGFAEEKGDQGGARQLALGEIAQRYDMALIGPNAEGFFNSAHDLAATFSPTVSDLDPGDLPRVADADGLGVVSQSGGIGFSFFHRGIPKRLPFSFIVTTGNEATLDALDVADYLVDDVGTGVILMFIEGVRSPSRLVPIAVKAARQGKPLIVAKVGRSQAATDAVASHTASLAGSHQAYEALFRQCGVINGLDSDHMIDVAAGFKYFRDHLPRGHRVGILTPSGGAGAWFADLCEANGLEVPVLDDQTRGRIDSLLPDYGTSRNPVDVTAQVIFTVGYAPVLKIMADSDSIDAILVSGSLAHPTYIERDLDELVTLREEIDKPIIFCAYTRAHPRAVELLAQAGFPCLTSMSNSARTLAAMADYHLFLSLDAPDLYATPGIRPSISGPPMKQHSYSEHEAKEHLLAWGIPCLPGMLVNSVAEAIDAARTFDGPVAMKLQSREVPHKTEIGGVALGLSDDAAIGQAFDMMMTAVKRKAPTAKIQGVRIEPMASAGEEILIGVTTEPGFSPILTLGSGGILVELINDVISLPVPLTLRQAQRMVEQLRSWPLLQGFRGRAEADVPALLELIVKVSDFAAVQGDALRALDLNPVIVHPRGNGITIADVLIEPS
ncbi:MAG: acetate--CoA ligase family protein [Arenicellales bacterium]|nr:acetate--CoA ligase family protein [Arenicellales bacterium]